MNLHDLAEKHKIDPENAKAFLLEWLGMQETYWLYDINGDGIVYQGCTGEDAERVVTTVHETFPESGKPFPLIVRPTNLEE